MFYQRELWQQSVELRQRKLKKVEKNFQKIRPVLPTFIILTIEPHSLRGSKTKERR